MGSTSGLRPLMVTGYSLISALGRGREQHLDALAAGRTGLGASPIPIDFETAVGALPFELPELPEELLPWATRLSRMAAVLIADLEAPLARARSRWRPERIGVILGTSTAGAETTEVAYRELVEKGSFPGGYDFHRQHTFGAALHVVRQLAGVDGPSWMISTACTSSGKSFATAQRLIAAGVIDAAIVGGVDTLCTMTLQGFQSLQALDATVCRPFSAERGGINIGEGGAFALVERDGDAQVLLEAVGETSDAYHISAPHPEGAGARAAMVAALAQAGCEPGDIDHVNAHGTGTQLNDIAESKAITAVLGRDVPVVSTKAFTGHTLGAAAAIEFVFAALAIEEGWIPPALAVDPVDPGVEVSIVPEVRRGRFRRVLSNSFAFGGNNVSLIVGAP